MTSERGRWGGSEDSGSSYFARDGKIYARRNGCTEECGTARSAHGHELERFEAALNAARAQRQAQEGRR